MHALPKRLKQLIFNKEADEPLSKEDEWLWNDWIASEQPFDRSFHLDEPVVEAAFREYASIERDKPRVWVALKERVVLSSGPGSSVRFPNVFYHLGRWALRTAIAAIIIGAPYLLFHYFTNKVSEPETAVLVTDSSQTRIVLSDGRTLPVNEIKSAVRDAGLTISVDNNLIKCESSNIPPGSEILYHQIITPRGGEHRVRLPDGSVVWLNAESSLRFSTKFAGPHRDVELTNGEAYFEIAHDDNRTFRVMANGTVITALGTEFNVCAYNKSEGVRTTLVEGKIEVLAGKKKQIVSPGEQVISTADSIYKAKTINIENVLAWKDGFINLEGETLSSIMDQVTRWYNVIVVYDKSVDKELKGWSGKRSKSSSINEVLTGFKKFNKGLEYRLEGRTLYIEPEHKSSPSK